MPVHVREGCPFPGIPLSLIGLMLYISKCVVKLRLRIDSSPPKNDSFRDNIYIYNEFFKARQYVDVRRLAKYRQP